MTDYERIYIQRRIQEYLDCSREEAIKRAASYDGEGWDEVERFLENTLTLTGIQRLEREEFISRG